MATQAVLISLLKKKASIQESETQFTSNADELLKSIMDAALLEHNAGFSYTNLPVDQERLVLLLAWEEVSITRASAIADAPNLSGTSGYGQDRNSPYYKNIDLAKKLREKYSELCSLMGLSTTSEPSSVVSSNIIIPSDELSGALVPVSVALPPNMVLSLAETHAGEVVLIWTVRDYKNFLSLRIAYMTGNSEALYQDWNFDSSTGIPKVNNSAIILPTTITDRRIRSVKVSGLSFTNVQYFLLIMEGLGNFFSYSNVLAVAAVE
jgi:hypothetical protein